MKNEDVQVGMKVVPHDKTVDGYCSLSESNSWNHARENKQPYLIVQEFDDGYWVLGVDDTTGGDFFNGSDFEPYDNDNSWIDSKIEFLRKEIKNLRNLKRQYDKK